MASPMLRPKAFVLLVPSRVKKILVLHQSALFFRAAQTAV